MTEDEMPLQAPQRSDPLQIRSQRSSLDGHFGTNGWMPGPARAGRHFSARLGGRPIMRHRAVGESKGCHGWTLDNSGGSRTSTLEGCCNPRAGLGEVIGRVEGCELVATWKEFTSPTSRKWQSSAVVWEVSVGKRQTGLPASKTLRAAAS